jgi:hypothetical protein
MPLEFPNSLPPPGPWQPAYALRLAIDPAALNKLERQSITQFLARLARTLDNPSYEHRFDEEGTLLVRARNGRDDAALIGVVPRLVHDAIRKALQDLVPQCELPVYEPFEREVALARIVVDQETRSTHSRLWSIEGLLNYVRGNPPARVIPADYLDLRPANAQHDQAQFAKLATWWRGLDFQRTLLPLLIAQDERRD